MITATTTLIKVPLDCSIYFLLYLFYIFKKNTITSIQNYENIHTAALTWGYEHCPNMHAKEEGGGGVTVGSETPTR